jgi:hypothetical protein
MLHNKRARALIVVVGLACAAVLAVVLVTRALATQSVSSPNGASFTVNKGSSLNYTIPLNTPVFILTAGKSDQLWQGQPIHVAAWSAVFCNGTYWNWVGERCGSGAVVSKGRRYQYTGVGISVAGYSGAGVYMQNNTGGLKFSVDLDAGGPMYAYIYY